mmetsp:Transcript_13001/g.52052  ORF Transcript_13001/g.52052 Transcript_13001/m.52052 type:complete len:503 (+) Transcript_13001:791-2299(+)
MHSSSSSSCADAVVVVRACRVVVREEAVRRLGAVLLLHRRRRRRRRSQQQPRPGVRDRAVPIVARDDDDLDAKRRAQGRGGREQQHRRGRFVEIEPEDEPETQWRAYDVPRAEVRDGDGSRNPGARERALHDGVDRVEEDKHRQRGRHVDEESPNPRVVRHKKGRDDASSKVQRRGARRARRGGDAQTKPRVRFGTPRVARAHGVPHAHRARDHQAKPREGPDHLEGRRDGERADDGPRRRPRAADDQNELRRPPFEDREHEARRREFQVLGETRGAHRLATSRRKQDLREAVVAREHRELQGDEEHLIRRRGPRRAEPSVRTHQHIDEPRRQQRDGAADGEVGTDQVLRREHALPDGHQVQPEQRRDQPRRVLPRETRQARRLPERDEHAVRVERQHDGRHQPDRRDDERALRVHAVHLGLAATHRLRTERAERRDEAVGDRKRRHVEVGPREREGVELIGVAAAADDDEREADGHVLGEVRERRRHGDREHAAEARRLAN